MATLEALKKRLPEGLKIVDTKDDDGWWKMEVHFCFEGKERVVGHLPKPCVYGSEENDCDMTIFCAMSNIAQMRRDMDMFCFWAKKIHAIRDQLSN